MSGRQVGAISHVNPDFLVIGAGAIGLASALELASTGASVVVLENDAVLLKDRGRRFWLAGLGN